MKPPENTNSIIHNIMPRQSGQDGNNNNINNSSCNDNSKNNDSSSGQNGDNCPVITPTVLIVIAALLGGALEVISVLVDRNRTVQVVLAGSLKQNTQKTKTELQKTMDQIGDLPLDEVMRALIGRLK